MPGSTMKTPITSALLGALAMAAAACDPGAITDPTPDAPAASRVAFVVQENGRPALYVQDADGGGRTRIHFAGAREMPGNPDLLPPLTDENVLALGPLAWSPDGARLAVVVTLAYDESELVVVSADGSDARVASLNTQIIMTAPDWSPDGTRLAYGMSTLPRAEGVQLFVTDLGAETWRQVTSADPVGSAGTNVRWSADGEALYLWRTIGQTDGASHDWVSRISKVDAATGVATVLVDSVAGIVQHVARGGTWALLIRNVDQPSGQDLVRSLVRRPLVGTGPELELARGVLWWARASADDRAVTLVEDADTSPDVMTLRASVVPIGGGTAALLPGLEPDSYVLDVLFE